ncbi:MAG: HAD-IB family hydrolase [Sphingopyxis sp.]|nr:HAD-IB family hydrolase [Sphingopyxis sp.]
MDRTITRRGTMSGFLMHVLARRQRWRIALVPLTGVTGLFYAARLVDRRRLKAMNLSLLLGRRFEHDRLQALAESYARRVIQRNIYPDALAQIEADRAAGYRIVLATASFRLYVQAIAKGLGIADVIATDTMPGEARLAGPNCYGADKRALIDAWLAAEGIEPHGAEIRAYSDHVSDTPMLELAGTPVATTPSPRLRRLAQRRGWTIVDWR